MYDENIYIFSLIISIVLIFVCIFPLYMFYYKINKRDIITALDDQSIPEGDDERKSWSHRNHRQCCWTFGNVQLYGLLSYEIRSSRISRKPLLGAESEWHSISQVNQVVSITILDRAKFFKLTDSWLRRSSCDFGLSLLDKYRHVSRRETKVQLVHSNFIVINNTNNCQ